jgi:hypothetical protein
MASKGIKDRVAIIGMGCTKFGEHWDKGAEDLLCEAAYEAYASAGVQPDDIDAYWLGTMGSGVSGLTLSEPLKIQYWLGIAPAGLLCGRLRRLRHRDGHRCREAQGLRLLRPCDDQSPQ